MGLEQQGIKPKGFTGKLVGILMNIFHTTLYIKYLRDKLPGNNSKILDIGCGGGKFLKYLSKINRNYILYGIDHSNEMIKLAKRINKKAINENRLIILNQSISDLKINNSLFNLITAFETVQFWNDIEKSCSCIHEMLDKGGIFLIMNRYPAEGTKWWSIAKIKNEKEYAQILKNAGFKKIDIDLKFKKGWIVINAQKGM